MGRYTNITKKLVIPAGAALSNAIFLGEKTLTGIQMPAAWTAAAVTFQTSNDRGVTWTDFHDAAGNEVKILNLTPGEFRELDPNAFLALRFLTVRSGVSASPVNQGSAASIGLLSTKFYPQ